MLVGLYAYFVWPFTHWSMNHLLPGDNSWWEYVLAIIFCVGSVVGFWCFSGAAFREKATGRPAAIPRSRQI